MLIFNFLASNICYIFIKFIKSYFFLYNIDKININIRYLVYLSIYYFNNIVIYIIKDFIIYKI